MPFSISKLCRFAIPLGLAVVAPIGAAAGSLSWSGIMVGQQGEYQRPTEDGTALADQGPVPYHALSIFVDRTGEYTLASDQRVWDPWDGFLALYAAGFDPERPLAGLAAAADDGPEGPGTSQLTATLVAGVVYRVVLSAAVAGSPDVFQGAYLNTVSGPGAVRMSACFPIGDEVDLFDDGTGISVLDELYCPSVTFRDHHGGEGRAVPVPHRSNESALFWFFEPGNWEVQVKVLDGCPVNGHRWVFFAGTTDVELEVEVVERHVLRRRTYRNDLANPTRSVLDTTAFSCDEALPRR